MPPLNASDPPPGAPAWQAWTVAGVLAVAALLCYLPALDGEFVNWDDPVYVTDNMHVREGLTGKTVAWAFTSIEQSNWHPLTWLSHAADVSLYGYVDARGHQRRHGLGDPECSRDGLPVVRVYLRQVHAARKADSA